MSALLFWKVRKGRLHLGTKKLLIAMGSVLTVHPWCAFTFVGWPWRWGVGSSSESDNQPRYRRAPLRAGAASRSWVFQ